MNTKPDREQPAAGVLYRPAGLGSRCDNYHRNLAPTGPFLVQCPSSACVKIVVKAGGHIRTLKRCRACAWRVRRGLAVEVINEDEL